MSAIENPRPQSTRRAFLSAGAVSAIIAAPFAMATAAEPDPVFALIRAEQAAWDALGAAIDAEERAITAFKDSGWWREPRAQHGWSRSFYDANFDPLPEDETWWRPAYLSRAQFEQADRDRRDWIRTANISDERRAELLGNADRQLAAWISSIEEDTVAIAAARASCGVDEATADMLAASTAAFEALNTLCSTTPTTAAGLLSMLDVCWARNADGFHDDCAGSIQGAFAAVRGFVGGREA